MGKKPTFKNEFFEEKSLDRIVFNEIEEKEIQIPKKVYTVRVTHPSLRIRRAPDLSAEIEGYIRDNGKYKIIDEKDGWGKLESGNWIMLEYTEKMN